MRLESPTHRAAAGLVLAMAASALVLAGCGTDDEREHSGGDVGTSGTNGGTGGGGAGGSGGTGGSGGSGGTDTGGAAGSGGAGGGEPAGTGGSGVVSGFDAGTAEDRNNVGPGQICDRLATLQCAGEAACCPDPGRSFDQCLAELSALCTDNFHFDEIAANPATGFNPAGAAETFAAVEQRASMCDPQLAQWVVSGAGFLQAFDGTVPANGSCTPPRGGSFTDFTQIFAMGDPDQIAALASCQNSETTVCMPSLTVWTCLPRSGEGGNCVFDGNCLDGLYCPEARTVTSRCTARKPVGSECVGANECDTFICIDDHCAEATVENAYCLQRLQ